MIWVSGGLDAWQRLSSLNHMAALLFPGWLDSFCLQPCTKQATSERETSPVSQRRVTFMYYWFFFFFIFVLAHSHVGASYEALRMNRTLHTLCKRNGISTPWRFLLWNCVDHCYGFTNYSVPLMNFSPWNLQSDRICIYLIAHLGFSFIHSGRRSFQIISYFNSTA